MCYNARIMDKRHKGKRDLVTPDFSETMLSILQDRMHPSIGTPQAKSMALYIFQNQRILNKARAHNGLITHALLKKWRLEAGQWATRPAHERWLKQNPEKAQKIKERLPLYWD